METQQHRPHRSAWMFWVGLSVTIALTLGLAGVIVWLVVTQNLAQLTVIVGLIASIVAIVSTPLIFYFSVFHKPEQKEALILPQQKETQTSQTQIPDPTWNVPFRRNPFFTGREELLKLLHTNLTTINAAALTQAQAISGLGGIGKTQVAVEYAYRYRDEYHCVLWVNGASRDTIITSFTDLAALLSLPEQQEQDQQQIVAAVLRWFASHDHWLAIFDNADDLSLVEAFLPPGGKGHLLLTTRAQTPGTLANGIPVEEMDLQEGMLLLLRRAKVLAPDAPLDQASATDRATAEAIVREMAGLPLALDQAGAYIEETHCSLWSYQEQYRHQQSRLLQRRGGTGKDHPDPVAKTWSLSFAHVEHLNATAADLLQCCAYLSPEAIPEQLLVEGASELGPQVQAIAADASRFDEAMSILLRYSLVQRKRDEHSITVHRLVQAVLRDTMDAATQRTWAERTVRAVYQSFPDETDYRTWPRCQQYLPHALACVGLMDQWDRMFPQTGAILSRVGYYLHDRAQYAEAEPLLQRAVAIGEKMLGPEHPDLAARLNNLATLYADQSKDEQAEPLYQRAIAIYKKTFGPHHPTTKTIQKNYARFLEEKQRKRK